MRCSISTSVLLVLVVFAAWAPAAQAAALYVDNGNPNCSNTGSGTATQPYCTISAAAAKTTAGTTVEVASGTYPERVNVKSGAVNNPVVFQAAPGAAVTVTGGQHGFYASNRSWVTIRGFNVTHTTGDAFHVSSGSSNVNVIDNHVSFAGEPEPNETAVGISVTNTTNSTVEGNTVDHSSKYGIYLQSSNGIRVAGNHSLANAKVYERAASGIRLYASSNNTITSNVSHHNEDSGIEIYTGSSNNLVVNNVTYGNGDHGVDIFNSTGQRVVSNSVYDNVTSGINAEGGSSSTTLANNISVDNGVDSPRTRGNIRVDSQSTAGTAIDYDLVDIPRPNVLIEWAGISYSSVAAFTAATGKESHGLQGDPMWVDRAGGDLHLRAGSPAVDSANSGTTGVSATDADGNNRVDDPAVANTGGGAITFYDRGAYERQLAAEGPPVAALNVTPSTGVVPLAVTADASASTDADATPIATYAFDFGDGTTTGAQPSPTAPHTYTAIGTYIVTVTVADTAGLSDTASAQVVVTEDAPAAALTVTPDLGLAPLSVTANASASTPGAAAIASYTFDFGDGSAATGPQPGPTATHTYSTPGDYTVTVTVRDTAGNADSAADDVVVKRNLVGNPGFENDLAGWNVSGSGSGVALTRVAGGKSGSWSAKLANTGAGASTCTLNDSPNWVAGTSAGTYFTAMWVRSDAPGAVLKLRLREYSGSTLVGSATSQITLSTSWQQVSVSYVAGSPGASTIDYNAYVVNAPPGTCFYADDASIYRN